MAVDGKRKRKARELLAVKMSGVTIEHLERWWGNDGVYDPREHLFSRRGDDDDDDDRLTCKDMWPIGYEKLWKQVVESYCAYKSRERQRVWKDVLKLFKTTPEWWDFKNTPLEFRVWVAREAGAIT